MVNRVNRGVARVFAQGGPSVSQGGPTFASEAAQPPSELRYLASEAAKPPSELRRGSGGAAPGKIFRVFRRAEARRSNLVPMFTYTDTITKS